jgi:hypothetical protein
MLVVAGLVVVIRSSLTTWWFALICTAVPIKSLEEKLSLGLKFTRRLEFVPYQSPLPLEVVPWKLTSRASLIDGPFPRLVNVAPVRATT